MDECNNKKVVLITGCAKGGIGYEYCKAFAAHGCHVFASDLPHRLPDLADLPSDAVEPLELDVSSDESVAAATSKVLSSRARVDVLVNNAGIGATGPLAELSLEAFRRAWEVNALGQLRMVQAVAPHMATRRSGRIVNVGSVVGGVATPWAGAYCASKAAVHALTDALRVELRPFGVHVVKVVPGAVRSGLGRANAERLGAERWRMYAAFADAIAGRAGASQVGAATEPGLLARHVARRVLSPKPPREIVFGHMTGLFAALALSPLWVRDWFFANRFGLDKKLQEK
ncbi:NADPH-dependent 1-acyldihydroxyacetone phosphate reductase-like [Canna indica]|uniref:NADPH-dependent 1-acyldihydroxyacetone phosphate reductase-like n=1 Tax=Canna indica TaxID=4628 RepID=A0AAQ3K5L1_9LILI|nr:NADPH-dependent 1-acyldihydroxyacetone phosphate reductase-like [Canna indica]